MWHWFILWIQQQFHLKTCNAGFLSYINPKQCVYYKLQHWSYIKHTQQSCSHLKSINNSHVGCNAWSTTWLSEIRNSGPLKQDTTLITTDSISCMPYNIDPIGNMQSSTDPRSCMHYNTDTMLLPKLWLFFLHFFFNLLLKLFDLLAIFIC